MVAAKDIESGKTGRNSGSGEEVGYTALEVARLCGYTSDRWTRDRRVDLEHIYYWCPGLLKTTDGKKYSQFALDEIRALQRATSSGVPALDSEGNVIMAKGRAKLLQVQRQMSLEEYAESVWQKHSKLPYSEASQADRSADPLDAVPSPVGTSPTLTPGNEIEVVDAELAEDPELQNSKLVFVSQESTTTIQVLDDAHAIAETTKANLGSFDEHMGDVLKNQFAGMAARHFREALATYQKVGNELLASQAAGMASEQETTVARKTTKKAT